MKTCGQPDARHRRTEHGIQEERRERRNGGAQPRHGQKQLHAANAGQPGRRAGQGGAAADGRDTRQSGQIQQQITQAAQQNSQTQGRLNTDFASQLAAKVQELKENQRKEWNSNYLTAISAAMGQQTTGSQQTSGTTDTTGEQHTEGSSHSTSVTYTNRGGGGSKIRSDAIKPRRARKNMARLGTGQKERRRRKNRRGRR